LFDNYEKNNFDDCKSIKSKFNQKIYLSYNLTHITFGLNFNHEVDLPLNLTHLTFGLPRKLFIILLEVVILIKKWKFNGI